MPRRLLEGWSFDYKTSFLTILITPLIVYVLLILKKYIKDWSGYIIEGLLYWATRIIRHSFAGTLTLRRYCKLKLCDDSRYLYVPSSLDIKLDIDTVFVPLTLEEQVTNDRKYNHANLLSVGNRIRIIGDPGSGKSSLVKKIYRDCLYHGLQYPAKARFPIIIELKNLEVPTKTKDLGTWFYNKIRNEVDKSKVYRMTECFDSYALNVGLLVLLDGLDEVSTSNYPKTQRAIEGLSDKLIQMSDKNCILLTMRTQFHQQIKDKYRSIFGHALFLNSFSPTDIYTFLTKWPFKDKAEKHIARIYKELTDHPTLREMCSNPLILSMYIAEDQAAGHVVAPESRTEFYKKVTEELIIKRRLLQTGPALAHSKLKEQRERILGRIAFNHMLDQKQPTNTLLLSDAYNIAVDITKCSKAEAIDLINEIAKETGLISEEIPGKTFRFIHLTFCEFLAAYEAIDGQLDGFVKLLAMHNQFLKNKEPYLRSRLIEVIPFACGLLPRIKRESALSSIELLKDSDLLCRCFLETKYYDHECWSVFVENQKDYLIGMPEHKWDERWLRNLHLFNVVIIDACQCSAHMPSISIPVDLQQFYQALVNTQQDSLAKLLIAYATQDAAAVFRLAEITNLDLASDFPDLIIDNCDQAPFYALVKQQALIDLNRIELWTALLSEAALRSNIVAKWMEKDTPSETLSPYINKVPEHKRWYKSYYPFKTFYTQCLTLSINSNPVQYPLLKLFYLVPPPNALNLFWNTYSFIYTTCILLPLSLLILYLQYLFSNNKINVFQTDKQLLLLCAIVIYSAIINIIITKKMTTLAYTVLMYRFRSNVFPDRPSQYGALSENMLLKKIRYKYINNKLKVSVRRIQVIINDLYDIDSSSTCDTKE